MKKFLALICVSFLAFSVACDAPEEEEEETTEEEGAEEEAEGEEAEEGEEEAAEAEEPAGPVELGELGVRAEVPADGEVGDAIGTDGVMVQAPGLVVTINEPGEFSKTDVEEARAEAEDLYSAENVETEELEDGWVLTFTNEGGGSTNYWTQSYRTVGDVEILCETTAISEEQQTNAVEFCKSVQE